MAKQAKQVNKIRKVGKVNKMRKVGKKGQQNSPTTSKRSTKCFSKAAPINLAQLLVHEFGTVIRWNLAKCMPLSISPEWLDRVC